MNEIWYQIKDNVTVSWSVVSNFIRKRQNMSFTKKVATYFLNLNIGCIYPHRLNFLASSVKLYFITANLDKYHIVMNNVRVVLCELRKQKVLYMNVLVYNKWKRANFSTNKNLLVLVRRLNKQILLSRKLDHLFYLCTLLSEKC